jgi:hypothetical protein
MKKIVVVCVAIDAKARDLVPNTPFLVKAGRADRSGVYDKKKARRHRSIPSRRRARALQG